MLCHMFAVGSMLCPFLEDHKEDILCGPVWLASGLDLSGHAGMLSLTSPKLVKGNNTSTYMSLISGSVFVVRKMISRVLQEFLSSVVFVLVPLQAWQEGSIALSLFTLKQ